MFDSKKDILRKNLFSIIKKCISKALSYKDIEDDKIPELEKFIEFIKNNPR